MVRRHADTAFMGGAHVFPGGRVDEADHDGDETWCDGVAHAARAAAGPAAWPMRSPTTSPPRASCSRKPACCSPATPAARSSRSPAPSDHERFKQDRIDGPRQQDDAARRRRTRTAAPRARRAGAVRALGDAADRHPPVRHALLHDAACRRTRRRRTTTPRRRTASGSTPAAAIAQSQRGEIVLPPPTWSTIRELEPFQSVDDALAWARRRRVVSRQPLLLEQDGLRMLLAPGDPLHPEPWRRRAAGRNALRLRRRPLAPGACTMTATPQQSPAIRNRVAAAARVLTIPRSGPLLFGHRVQPALDRDCRRRRAERAGHLGHRGARVFRAAGVLDAGAVVAISGRRRHLRLEQARVRAVRGVHHRLDLLGIEPAVFSRAAVFRRRQRAVHRRTGVAIAVVEQRATSSRSRWSASPSR